MIRALFAMAIVAALLPAVARAAVFSRDWKAAGDGLLTYDDVNRREWLDLTESRLAMFAGGNFEQRFQNALHEFAPGGTFGGFQPASSAELAALALSAGIVLGDDFEVNTDATRQLIDLAGGSQITSLDPEDRVAFGLLGELRVPPIGGIRLYGQLIHFVPRAVTAGAADLFVRASLDVSDLATPSNSGIWMYRAVPEPQGIVLCCTALAPLCSVRRRSA